MAIYKNISSKTVIAKIYRDFRPTDSNWVNDAIEWMGEAIEYIGAYTELILKPFCVDVIEYKAKLPCALEFIEGIEYNGSYLPLSTSSNSIQGDNINLPVHTSESCKLNPNYIHTTFQTGKIIIHGLVTPVDCDGFPLIPDSMEFKQALAWYIMFRLIARGYKHQVYKDIIYMEATWEKWAVRARNRAYAPDIISYEKFKNSWNNVIIDVDKAKKLFNTDLELTSKADNPDNKYVSDFTIVRV